MIVSICIQVHIIFYYFCYFCSKKLSTHLSTFEAENRLFHKHAEAQLKKVRAYKKKRVYFYAFKKQEEMFPFQFDLGKKKIGKDEAYEEFRHMLGKSAFDEFTPSHNLR